MLIECTENGTKGTENDCELYGAVLILTRVKYLILQVFISEYSTPCTSIH